MAGRPWTKSELKQAFKICASAESTQDREATLRKALNRTFKSTDEAFRSRAMKVPPIAHVLEPIDPVDRKREEGRVARIAREHKDMVTRLEQAEARQAFLDAAKLAKPLTITRRERSSGLREATAVTPASDWHVGETVERDKISYPNEFNPTIANERINRYFDSVIWQIEHQRASKRIMIRDWLFPLMGDLMTGFLHRDQEQTNSMHPTEEVAFLLPRLEAGINLVMKRLSLASCSIVTEFGNHGRLTVKPLVNAAAENNFEWLMYNLLAERFKGQKEIKFNVTRAKHNYTHVYDFWVHTHHGDSIRYQGGVGGIGIPLLKAVAQWDKQRKSHLHIIGHWHQLRDYGNALVNGSLIGWAPYSEDIRADPEDPAQLFFLIDSERGKCQSTPLWVAKRQLVAA